MILKNKNLLEKVLKIKNKGDFLMDEEELILEKDRTRAIRRRRNITKALRKRHISRTAYRYDWYNNLHQYSKNKIHCSCCMCAFNNKKKKYKVYSHSDLMKMDSMTFKEKEISV